MGSLHAKVDGALQVGDVLAERYAINRLLGEGAMGQVFEATDRETGTKVALKVISAGGMDDGERRARFKREMDIARRASHRNLCRVLDVGEDDDRDFFCMELLDGETLADRIQRASPMPPALVLDLLVQMAAGLGAAHAAGIVHRDFKPSNVMLVAEGDGLRAVVMDFGIAKSTELTETLTRTGAFVGTPAYCAPEQLESGNVSPASDVYAFGVVLYHMLSGALPFESTVALIHKLSGRPIPPIRRRRPELDPIWDGTIARCLAARVEDRFQTVDEVVAALRSDTPSTTPIARTKGVAIVDFVDDERAKNVLARLGGFVASGGRALFARPTAAMIAATVLVRVDPHARVAIMLHEDGEIALFNTARPGQILLTEAARAAIENHVRDDTQLRDIGRRLVRGMTRPTSLFQLVVDDVAAPIGLRTSEVRGLVAPANDLIGRVDERKQAWDALRSSRLVTLTGPAGTGKSRLAMSLAAEAAFELDDGVFYVALASVRDASLVPSALAQVLGVTEAKDRPLVEAIKGELAPRQALLVLDNFEHLLDAAPIIDEILRAAPGLRLLVTSQARLRLEDEHVLPIPPLPLPSKDIMTDVPALASVEAVALFVERGAAVAPGFALTRANASTIATIVARLDGLPLAIELAAARVGLFAPEELLARLDQRLKVLTSGAKDGDPRHRRLRDAVAWSHDLLEEEERVLFRRAGAFVGGFDYPAIEHVADSEGDVADLLESLIEKSLIVRQRSEDGVRFLMLETIRELAVEKLREEHARIARRHAEWFAALAEKTEAILKRHGQRATLARLVADDANLRAALQTCTQGSAADLELGLRFAGSLWRYWHAVGRYREGREILSQLLARKEATTDSARAKALVGLAGLAYWQADYRQALASYREALALYERAGDELATADTRFALSTTSTWSGDVARGTELANEALATFRRLGKQDRIGEVLMAQGFARWMAGDLEGALPLWEESRDLARAVGDEVEVAHKSLAIAALTYQRGRHDDAIAIALQALEDLHRLQNAPLTVMAIDFLASMIAGAAPDLGVELAGTAATLRAVFGGGMRPTACGLEDAKVVAGRTLDPLAIERAWNRGREASLETAVATARRSRTP